MADKVRITQIRSPIGRPAHQRATLAGLKLNKLHRSRVVDATSPSVMGQVDKVKHLLKVEPVTEEGGAG
jgi:large subunit ribosomal protein L30